MNSTKIQEHLSAVVKHWTVLMSGIASVAISVYEHPHRALRGQEREEIRDDLQRVFRPIQDNGSRDV